MALLMAKSMVQLLQPEVEEVAPMVEQEETLLK